MLNSITKSREFILKEILGDKDFNSDTLYLVEGFSSETGNIYSAIWSSEFSPINFKSFFGENVTFIDENIISEIGRKKISPFDFTYQNGCKKNHGGNRYLITIFIIENGKVISTHHAFSDKFEI